LTCWARTRQCRPGEFRRSDAAAADGAAVDRGELQEGGSARPRLERGYG